jgi:hypothetical protein
MLREWVELDEMKVHTNAAVYCVLSVLRVVSVGLRERKESAV